ncbi:oxygen-independent coproporphyrinogen-3 oxidase [Bosea sp. BE125]|uniref:oxygen-independent coproporphyrinogen III oxidase n=1 Tax=Bosea sp. BE125 TaxID=2817909 RepID=UPI0028672A52|nr:oxygen-independent coproporphyrinogen III oxidase [Bosea sp. BE125]MDR6870362.1 oxygen-independent coproporphyrinogen-3 oxidase [Bosea sp. BE125]
MTSQASSYAARQVPRYTSYPTAPHFTGGVDAALYRRWLSELDGDEPVSVYVHVPFCAELCLYCGCQTTVTRSPAPVLAYVDLLLRELELVGKALPGRKRLSHLHFGGGTPTILDMSDFRRLMAAIRANFDIEADAELAIEVDPRTISPAHAATLVEAGINRVSLGVQSFDPLVQKTIRRRQSFELTSRVAEWFRFAGVEGLNLDLMYGLPHQNVANVLSTVHQALSLDPDRIALFGYAHVPWMKRHQALLPEAALPGSEERAAQFEAAAARILAAGYVRLGLDHFAKPDDALCLSARAGELRRNFQGYTTDGAKALIGLGSSAISRLPQGYAQNAATVAPYRSALSSNGLATARGVPLTPQDNLRAGIIERLTCDFSVDLAALCRQHGFEIGELDDDLGRLQPMVRDGLAIRDGARINVAPAAQDLVRVISTAFDQRFVAQLSRHSPAV